MLTKRGATYCSAGDGTRVDCSHLVSNGDSLSLGGYEGLRSVGKLLMSFLAQTVVELDLTPTEGSQNSAGARSVKIADATHQEGPVISVTDRRRFQRRNCSYGLRLVRLIHESFRRRGGSALPSGSRAISMLGPPFLTLPSPLVVLPPPRGLLLLRGAVLSGLSGIGGGGEGGMERASLSICSKSSADNSGKLYASNSSGDDGEGGREAL